MKDLISVIIPVFNVEKFVEEAINSIRNQTYKNLEIIIIDDASTDNTYNIIKKLEEEDSRIITYRNNKNSKIVESLNFGISKAKGKYIARMDGDDTCSPNKLYEQYLYLQNHPEISLVGTNLNVIDEKGNYIFTASKCNSPYKMSKYIKYASPIAHIWMTTKEIYNKIGPYRMPGVEDYDFLLRLLSNGYLIANINDSLYNVRIRNGNTISTMGLKQYKAMKYAYSLYKYRIINQCINDTYNIEEYKNKIHVSDIHLKLFSISSQNYAKAQNWWKKNKLLSFYYLMLSFVTAPIYRTKSIYASLLIRLINKQI